jgi:hypothetical protein
VSRLLSLVLVACIATPAALADGGASPGVVGDGHQGITDSRTGLTYTALDGTTDTFVVVRNRAGREIRSSSVHGSWGIPLVTWNITYGGLSHDGKTLVLARPPAAGLAHQSRLLVLDATTLRPRRQVGLRGDFSFDAISPDDRTLFLIQHTSAADFQRYRVRAYDLVHGTLDPHAIVDKTEPNMAGSPIRRLVGPGARWVYTLYANQDEYFVHALDTVHAQARCLDLDWHGDPNAIANTGLAIRGKRLAVLGRGGHELTSISLPAEPEAAGWAVAGWTAVGSLAALAAAAFLVLRRRAKTA